jgi:putative NADH-flavin reductase
MRLLILGATGRTGKHLLTEALKRGHNVNILVRDASKVSTQSPNLTVLEGTPTHLPTLEQAMQHCEVVISALNISRTSDFPWAALRTPTDFLSNTISNVIQLVPKLGTKHVLITSAWGVLETKPHIPFWFRWFIDHSNIGYGYREHENQERLLQKSEIVYTAVRPVGLTNDIKPRPVRVSFDQNVRLNLTISRLSVAKFMLDAAEQGTYLRQTPAISA